MTPEEIKTYARSVGFDEVKITSPTPKTWDCFIEWLHRGYHGEMRYLANRAEERRDPAFLLESTRSVIVVAKRYLTEVSNSSVFGNPFLPIISRYAWGDDYHLILADGLKQIVDFIQEKTKGCHRARWCVDTSPVLERDFAVQAGVGWRGKHANVLNRSLGNWFFLGVILTTLELEPDRPESNHCGTCSRCIDCCPTRAIIAPYILDARRCISYLTIELKGAIPREFRHAMGRRIYGCDDCLEACPWNRFAVPTQEAGFFPRESLRTLDLIQLMKLTGEEFRDLFKNSPIKRTKRRGFLRNVAVALGNSRDPRAVPVLLESLSDSEPLIRGHAAWALGEIGGSEALAGLQQSLERETDDWVKEESTWAYRKIDD